MKFEVDKFRQENPRLFHQEMLIFQVTEALCLAMEKAGLSRSALAAKVQKARPQITEILNGRNLTLRTISDLFLACGANVDFIVTYNATPRKGGKKGKAKK